MLRRMLRWPMMVAWSLAGLFASAPSIAHDWYPWECCSNFDCRALVESRGETITEVPEGWQLWDDRVIGRLERRDHARAIAFIACPNIGEDVVIMARHAAFE